MEPAIKIVILMALSVAVHGTSHFNNEDICNITYIESKFVKKDIPLSENAVSAMWRLCNKNYSHCQSNAYPFFIYGTPHRDHFSVGVIGLGTHNERCWGYYFNAKDQQNNLIVSKYYPYSLNQGNHISKHTLNFTKNLLNSTLKLELVQIPSGVNVHRLYALPQNECQQRVSFRLTEYYWSMFDSKRCNRHFDHSNIFYVAKKFCERFDNPTDEEFISKHLNLHLDMFECFIVLAFPEIIKCVNAGITKNLIFASLGSSLSTAVLLLIACQVYRKKKQLSKLLKDQQKPVRLIERDENV